MSKWNLSIRRRYHRGIIRRRSFNAIFPAHPTSSPHIHLPCEMKSFNANTNSSREKINLQGFMWGDGSKSFVRENVFVEAHHVEKLRLCRQSTHRGGKCYVSQWIFLVSREALGVIGGFVTDPKCRAATSAECDDTETMNASPLASSPTFLLRFYGMTRRSLWCSRRKLFDHRQWAHDSSIIYETSRHTKL